uniref:CARD domain-containing protein n=1 Tax=Amphilophus citrinellus TaxID=61819 RepID=A0A3Q0R279_AMPCI
MKLDRVRTAFVWRVSAEILTQLLDALVSDRVLNELEKEFIMEENQSRANKARCFIDTVKKKGDKACTTMIHHLQNKDPTLFSHLHLSSDPSVQEGEDTYLCNKGFFAQFA